MLNTASWVVASGLNTGKDGSGTNLRSTAHRNAFTSFNTAASAHIGDMLAAPLVNNHS